MLKNPCLPGKYLCGSVQVQVLNDFLDLIVHSISADKRGYRMSPASMSIGVTDLIQIFVSPMFRVLLNHAIVSVWNSFRSLCSLLGEPFM